MGKIAMVADQGGRGAALAWGLAQDPEVETVYVAPGNAGTERLSSKCKRLPTVKADDIEGILSEAQRVNADLLVPGPEKPLVEGIVDRAALYRVPTFGPNMRCARLEGSKWEMKKKCRALGVPTADWRTFTDSRSAIEFLRQCPWDPVIKVDWLWGGKGVELPEDIYEAETYAKQMLDEGLYGEGDRIIIEKKLPGRELSAMVVCANGQTTELTTSRDFKRALEGDNGKNTGGMGAISPVPDASPELIERYMGRIIRPMAFSTRYDGLFYGGLMIVDDEPNLLEVNCRFGDPESQVVIPRLRGSLYKLLKDACNGTVPEKIGWKDEACVTFVLASGGYPGDYQKGFEIFGLDDVAVRFPDILIFHAGTENEGKAIVTAGGRVINVTALGEDIEEARQRALAAIRMIRFEGMHYRNDIGIAA